MSNRTPTEERKHRKILKAVFFGSEFVSIIAPFLIIGIVNYDEYFVEYNGTKTSIAFVLSMIVMGIAVWLVSKKKLEGTFATLILGWIVIDAIFFLLGSIIVDISYIMLFGLIGLIGAAVLQKFADVQQEKIDEIDKGIEKAKTDSIATAYSEEQKTIKLKIKK